MKPAFVVKGHSGSSLHRAEEGDAAVTMGTYIKGMAVMAIDADVALLVLNDTAEHLVQDAQLPARRAGTSRAQLAPC